MFSSNLACSQLFEFLSSCDTGAGRIPAGIDDDKAIIAHKTGTGFSDADGNPTGINDAAFIILPSGKSYSIAVMVRTTQVDMDSTEKIIADVSRIVYEHISD